MTAGWGRPTYLALALGTIGLGLAVHFGGGWLGRDARDVAGDALWAAMMAWWVGAAAPRARLRSRSAVTGGICLAVEASQLIRTPALDAVRETTLGSLGLGSGFDPRDLAAYALGVAAAGVLERALRPRGGLRPRSR